MAVTGKDTSRVIRKMIKYLDAQKSGTEISTFDIFLKACSPELIDCWTFKIGDCIFDEVLTPDGEKHDFLFEMHYRFSRAAERHGYELDSSKYDDLVTGLPYNIPIVFRRPRGTGRTSTLR